MCLQGIVMPNLVFDQERGPAYSLAAEAYVLGPSENTLNALVKAICDSIPDGLIEGLFIPAPGAANPLAAVRFDDAFRDHIAGATAHVLRLAHDRLQSL